MSILMSPRYHTVSSGSVLLLPPSCIYSAVVNILETYVCTSVAQSLAENDQSRIESRTHCKVFGVCAEIGLQKHTYDAPARHAPKSLEMLGGPALVRDSCPLGLLEDRCLW